MSKSIKKFPPLSLSAKIFIGMGLGIFTGVFFGELAQKIYIVGQVFIQLLQIPILPFLMLSLITGLGGLTYREALSLAKKVGVFLLVLWSIALIMLTVVPMTYPAWESAMFFSPSLVEEPQAVDFLQLYIPANPFFAMANSIVPALVLFSIIVGVTLIGVERKQPLLDVLSVFRDAMTGVTGVVIKLAPLGVFAISASAAGTMEFEELGRLQVYLVSYIAAALFLTFGVLPALVASLTPLKYKEIIRFSRGALLTAFATGNAMIILPLLTESGRELLRRAELVTEEAEAIDVIIPTSYSFPSSGLLLSLTFVPFAGWFVGSELSFSQYPGFLLSGLASFFGGTIVGIPFLLDLYRIPADMFKLFLSVDVFTGRFGTLTATMHMWVLGLLGSCAMAGRLKVRWQQLVFALSIMAVLGVAVIGGIRLFFTYAINPEYTKYRAFSEMALRYEPSPSVIKELPPDAPIVPGQEIDNLQALQRRGILRVGYFRDSLPFAFRNNAGELVGFDIEMAHLLAKDLQVKPEFILLPDRSKTAQYLNNHICDIVMSGSVLRPGMATSVAYSESYMDLTIALIVKDHKRDVFRTWENIRAQKDLRIGIPANSHYYRSMAEKALPDVTYVQLESPRDFFKGKAEELDALFYLAEPGSAWTLIYPAYTVVVPQPDPVAIPAVYPMARKDQYLVDFINASLELKKRDGTVDAVFEYWILGKGATGKTQRWSIIRNVLHWVD
ncbi:MAG: cation:dicarboxylase symporter family transporter [Gammaproteobacteria bacterium]|nr:cation:dicarboxylase symporter family transporter [Gammaproteobacteria bacterium]